MTSTFGKILKNYFKKMKREQVRINFHIMKQLLTKQQKKFSLTVICVLFARVFIHPLHLK